MIKDYINHNEILRNENRNVKSDNDYRKELSELLIDQSLENNGVGIACPQLGINEKAFAITYKDYKKTFFNPKISLTGNIISSEEGCLSVPGISGKVKRNSKVIITYEDIDCNEITETLEYPLSVIAQHEYDHLQGILFIDYLHLLDKICPNCHKLHKNEKGYCSAECYKEFRNKKRAL